MSNTNTDFLVQKPQFSATSFNVGDAVAITTKEYIGRERKQWYNKHCIVHKVFPLELHVQYLAEYDREDDRRDMTSYVIPVDKVADGTFQIEKLVRQSFVKPQENQLG